VIRKGALSAYWFLFVGKEKLFLIEENLHEFVNNDEI
jgi:hypothetical protein